MKEVNSQDFYKEVVEAKGLTLVDLWADWCGPCKAMSPTLEELSEDLKDKVAFVKVDVEANPDTAALYEVRSIPTLLLFKDGLIVGKMVGSNTKDKVAEFIETNSK